MISNIEELLRTSVVPSIIQTLIDLLGVPLKLYRSDASSPYAVYGSLGDKSETYIATITGLLATSEEFITSGQGLSTPITVTYLFTLYDDVKVGDVIVYERPDGTIRRWRVTSIEHIGYTQAVAKRYRLSEL